MNNATSIALGSMQITAAKATDAANNVAHTNVVTSGSTTDRAMTPAVINDTSKAPAPDALQDILDFQAAARAHEAQLKAIQALNDMQQKLVEALGWAIPQSPDTVASAQPPSSH